MSKFDVVGQDSDHASKAPSAANEWINCPGSINKGKGIEQGCAPEAMLGTAAHSLASVCLNESVEPDIYDGEVMMVQDGKWVDTFKVDDNMHLAVSEYTEFCASLEEPGCSVGIEERVDLTWLHPELHGTLDFECFNRKKKILDVVDYKHGEGVSVSPELNYQLMIYAIGCISMLKNRGLIKQQAAKEIEVIRLNIVQPRDRNNPQSVRTWAISYMDLEQWMFNILTPAVHRTDDPLAPLLAGPWCTWCNASAICEARIGRGEELLGTTLANPTMPVLNTIHPERLGRLLQFLEELGGWRKKVDAYALNMLERGQIIPGYKLVKRRSNRKWIDDVEPSLVKIFGTEAYEQKTITITKAEAMLKKKKQNLGVLKPLTIKPDTGNTIANQASVNKEVAVKPMYLNFIEDSDMFAE